MHHLAVDPPDIEAVGDFTYTISLSRLVNDYGAVLYSFGYTNKTTECRSLQGILEPHHTPRK